MGAKLFKSINILDRGNNDNEDNKWEEKEIYKYGEIDQLFYSLKSDNAQTTTNLSLWY